MSIINDRTSSPKREKEKTMSKKRKGNYKTRRKEKTKVVDPIPVDTVQQPLAPERLAFLSKPVQFFDYM